MMSGNASNILAMVRKYHPSVKRYTLANYLRGQLQDAIAVSNYLPDAHFSNETMAKLHDAIEAMDRECAK